MNKWLLVSLLTTLIAAIAEGVYTVSEIESIVVHHVMPFWTFPQNHHQYGVLLLLPADKKIHLVPEKPGTLNQKNEYTRGSYNKKLIDGDALVGINYAVARPSADGKQHTEAQLIKKLPDMLAWYKVQFNTHPATLLLYTRGTPCSDCTIEIAYARQYLFPNGQFVVAYTKNLVNSYMTPSVNCKNRNYLRKFYHVAVLCVKERYDNFVGKDQCIEDDFTVNCAHHDQRYGALYERKKEYKERKFPKH